MSIGVTFSGVSSSIYGEITVSRGIAPSVGILVMLPQDRPALGPGDLRFEDADGNSADFPDCLPSTPFIRRAFPDESQAANRWRWELTIQDHRWRWQYGSISGEYNKRLPDGTVDPAFKKEPNELANLCLAAMNEAGFDTSLMPTGVYPYVNWQNANPALALWSVCEKVACEVTGGEFAKVTIYPRGTGADLPSGGQLHDTFRFGSTSSPNKLIVEGGPTVWQTKMATDAVGRESDGTQKKVSELSYLSSSYTKANPMSFSTLTGDNLQAALETVWRWFRVKGQADGSLAVPGCTETIADVTQYFPLRDVLLDSANDLNTVKRSLPSVFEGTYWAFTDDATNVASSTRYLGQRKLLADRGIVETEFPVFGLSSTGAIAAPTMFLTATHLVRKTDGSYVGLERSQTLGGSGATVVLKRPELFASIKVNWSGTTQSGTTDTLAQANAEADKYLSIFATAYSGEMDDQEYVGIKPIQVDGNVAQVLFAGGVSRPFRTRASTVQEFDVGQPSAAERRRRNLLELQA